ncbi:hypothetical protein K3495_g2159 [Podosphaera aphanis]|nr:hypothetical protein K3495_g2159 [Podosphaera aphanis]
MAGNDSSPQSVSMSDFNKLKHQLDELVSKQQTMSKPSPKKAVIEKDPPNGFAKKIKPTSLPDFHDSRIRYPAWRTTVLDTSRMDWNMFGYDDSRSLMIYNALKGGALEKAGSFYEAGGIMQTRNPEDFIEFLDRLYPDSTRVF